MSDTKSPFAAVSTDNLHAAVMDAVALMGKVILTDEPLLRASHVLRSALVQYADSQLAAPVAPATVAVPDSWGIYRAYGSKGELLLVHNEQKAVATSIDENNPAYGILNAMLAASQREGGVT